MFKGVNPDIASMWESLDEAAIKQLKELSNTAPAGLISASTNFSEGRTEENGELDHHIGAATTKHCPNHLSQLEVPASTWAVFEAAGSFPDALQEAWGGFIPNGFHRHIMNKLKAQKSCGTSIRM